MHWGTIGIGVLGLVLIFAPWIGELWARGWRRPMCIVCGRELVGSPPEHKISDRAFCRDTARWGR